MPRLIPSTDPSEISNSSERKVAQALVDQLPSHVIVVHSFNWLGKNRHETFIEGECDFIIIDEKRGLLFVEVKGGILRFDETSGEWLRHLSGGRVSAIKNPTEQATRSMHEIVRVIKQKIDCEDMPCTYGFAVAFPDGNFSGTAPVNLPVELIIDASKLSRVAKALSTIFGRFARPAHRALTKNEIAKITRALFPKFEILPVAWRTIEQQEQALHRMTEDQKSILDTLSMQNSAIIEGGAGTGKTLIAIAKAQQVAGSGKRVLLLCYNRPLKEWLVRALSDENENLAVNNYHGLVHDACQRAGLEFISEKRRTDQDFWNNEAPAKLMDAYDKLPLSEKFDAVIVDEGQDFRELWWLSLESVFRNAEQKDCFYIFADPNQNLYMDELSMPQELLNSRYGLSTVCRNTKRIADHCAELIGAESRTRLNAPKGEHPAVRQFETMSDALDEVRSRVRKLCTSTQGGLSLSQVAVLAPRKTESLWPSRFGKEIPATQSIDSWRGNRGVLVATPHQFKGLEVDVVFVITKPLDGSDSRTMTENYVARSRAKHMLFVIEVAELGAW